MASSSSVNLQDLGPFESAATPSPQVEHLLSYPTTITPVEEQSANEQAPTVLKDRLYIGNLHPTVDEFSLLQVFSKFGKVTKLDFLFHKSGALKGKPRGYAFIEYGLADEAHKALTMAHDKLLRGRKLVVTYAHQAPLDQSGNSVGASGSKHKKTMMEIGRPTTLSMIKTGMSNRREPRTVDKIAVMEAKLRQLETAKPVGSGNWSSNSISSGPSSSTLPSHPSLPVKPPPPLPNHLSKACQQNATLASRRAVAKPLPSLPIQPHSQSKRPIGKINTSPSSTASTFPQHPSSHTTKSVKLAGVIMKAKQKHKEEMSTPPG